MKTPNLFDVPKTAPTKRERYAANFCNRKAKLAAFKRHHVIATHDDGDPTNEGRWLAVLLSEARELAGWGHTHERTGDVNELAELFASVGRLIDEAGLSDHGKTEREAIRELCEKNDIPFTL